MKQTARVFVGVLSSITLLALIILDFLKQDLVVTERAIIVLLVLISSTLGMDMILEQFPITIKISSSDNKEK